MLLFVFINVILIDIFILLFLALIVYSLHQNKEWSIDEKEQD